MGTNTFAAALLIVLSGLAAASQLMPFRGIKRWSFGVSWLVQSFAAFLLFPVIAARLLIPSLFPLLHGAFTQNASAVWTMVAIGVVFGISALLLGLAVRYIGFGLAYALTLGVFGMVRLGSHVLQRHSPGSSPPHPMAWISLAAIVAGFLCAAVAGARKDREMSFAGEIETPETDFDFRKGLWLSVGAALLAMVFRHGLEHGSTMFLLTGIDYTQSAAKWQGLPALVLLLAGAFLTNAIWSLISIVRRGLAGQLTGTPGVNPMRSVAITGNTMPYFDPEDPQYAERLSSATLFGNYALALVGGLLWFAQIPLALAATTGFRYGWFSGSLPAAAAAVGCAPLWGLALREWRGISGQARALFSLGIVLTVAALLLATRGL